MNAFAGQLSIGPLAAARLQTLAACSLDSDEAPVPRTTRRSAREVLVFAVAAALVALMVIVIGQTMPRTSADALVGTPDQVIVVDPDGQEPFVVCTIRAGVRRCTDLELVPAQP